MGSNLNKNDYLTIVASSEFNSEHEKKYINSMLAMGVDGFLVQPTKLFNEVVNTKSINKPIVYFDSASENDEMFVKTNNYEITYTTINKLIDNKVFFKAYHMNKNNWITINLDSNIDFNYLCKLIDDSYNNVK